jgi:WD40 repeat protein
MVELVDSCSSPNGSVRLLYWPDGNIAISIQPDIEVWDPETGDCVKVSLAIVSGLLLIVRSPDGQMISGSRDQTVKIWDLAGNCRESVKLRDPRPRAGSKYGISKTAMSRPFNLIVQQLILLVSPPMKH